MMSISELFIQDQIDHTKYDWNSPKTQSWLFKYINDYHETDPNLVIIYDIPNVNPYK
jgi:hypothetical protein